MKSWSCIAVLSLAMWAQGTAAQTGTPQAFVQGQLSGWFVPRASEFASSGAMLAKNVQARCDGAPPAAARTAWTGALLAWSRLSASTIGPLVERRSARRIDFAPTRPELIERAIALAPADRPDLDQIGSAAKGFGALESLLWADTPPDAARCAYAVQVAADIAREAEELAGDFAAPQASTTSESEEAQATTAMAEAVNQWLGGLERLRLQGLERPLAEARSRGTAPHFGRDASGAGLAERMAHWQALRALAVGAGSDAAGAGLLPLEGLLRAKGLGPLASRLAGAVRQADQRLAATRNNTASSVHAAARALDALRTLVENDVAPALDVRASFSDADGD